MIKYLIEVRVYIPFVFLIDIIFFLTWNAWLQESFLIDERRVNYLIRYISSIMHVVDDTFGDWFAWIQKSYLINEKEQESIVNYIFFLEGNQLWIICLLYLKLIFYI